jgi:hypothetical protein
MDGEDMDIKKRSKGFLTDIYDEHGNHPVESISQPTPEQ